MQMADGSLMQRNAGTPQGGVISPVLSNLYLHYVFDKWMKTNYPKLAWCRYADDGLVHCHSEQEAITMLQELKKRFTECGLTLHPDKTKIVYCKDDRRKEEYSNISFDFLGYTFKARRVKGRTNKFFMGFNPAVSKAAKKAMRNKTRSFRWQRRTDLSLGQIAAIFNPVLSGWINYYGRYYGSELEDIWRHFNCVLVKWATRKYKRLRKCRIRSVKYLERIRQEHPHIFSHWKTGMGSAFA